MPAVLENRNTLMESAKALWVQGNPPQAIADTLNMKVNTLLTWARRFNWVRLKSDIQAKVKESREIAKVKRELEVIPSLRHELAKAANAQVVLLNKNPPRRMSDLPGRDGYAATLKTIVESVAKIESWDAQDGLKLNLGLLSSFQLPQAVESKPIDVEEVKPVSQ